MNQNQSIGSNIKELRKRMGLSQDALAKYLDIHREAISYYETGNRTVSVEELMKLADLFGCEVADLLVESAEIRNTCLAFAFRADELKDEDLESIASFKKIVKNYLNLINLQSAGN